MSAASLIAANASATAADAPIARIVMLNIYPHPLLDWPIANRI